MTAILRPAAGPVADPMAPLPTVPPLPSSPPLPTVPRRIHIIGGPGSGKTTLAGALGAALDLPVIHLDDVARVGGGTGRIRTPAERDPLVAAILAGDAWIAEGVHLGWTEPLLASAELIIWLEAATGSVAAGRIAERFWADAWAELRRRSWRQRIAAIPGHARHARDLVGAMIAARRYARTDAPASVDPSGTLDSRAATQAALAAHTDRVRHVGSHAEADALVTELEARAGAAAAGAV
jgi:predicted kinase